MLITCKSLFVIAFILTFASLAQTAQAQDTLVMKDGSEIYGKLLEIGERTVSYRKKENPDGPAYTIDLGKIFMVFYKNGRREAFNSNQVSKNEFGAAPANNDANSYSDKISISDDLYKIDLVSLDKIPAKKREIYKASAVVFLKGKKLLDVDISANQSTKETYNYLAADKAYCNNNYILASVKTPKSLSDYLFNKYESYNGTGYGWAIPPRFFDVSSQACSVALVKLKNDLISISGSTVAKMNLKDCSSVEKRILSFVLLWLNENFKTQSQL